MKGCHEADSSSSGNIFQKALEQEMLQEVGGDREVIYSIVLLSSWGTNMARVLSVTNKLWKSSWRCLPLPESWWS